MSAIFVHLSDIHFGQERRGGQRVVNEDARERLVSDAADLVTMLGGKPSGIIVTGDIAYAGKAHEYETAGKWLDQLAHRIGCARSAVQLVPGNHDVDRAKIAGATELMLERIHADGEAELDRFLDRASDRELLYERFAAYRSFADAYQCPLDCTGNSSSDRRVELQPGRAIRFVRLNSALVCSKTSAEKGKLLLGARQRVMRDACGEELVVLSHHPVSWFADSEDAQKYLRSRARVFISGHEHLGAVKLETVEEGRDLLTIAAGATTPDDFSDHVTYAYNVLSFSWDESADALAVLIGHRVWNDAMKRFEPKSGMQGTTFERYVMGSPNFRSSGRPPSRREVVETNEQPTVEIVNAPRDPALTELANDSEYQALYLRFFRDIRESDRLRLLVEIGVMPVGQDFRLNHELESRLFRAAVRHAGMLEVGTRIDAVLAVNNAGGEE